MPKLETHEFLARTRSPVADCKWCGRPRIDPGHSQEPVEETWETRARRNWGGPDYPSQRPKL